MTRPGYTPQEPQSAGEDTRTRPGPALRGNRNQLPGSPLWSQSSQGNTLYPVGMGCAEMILSRK